MIAIPPQGKLVADYQRLLQSDWNRDFPQAVLALLWKALPDYLTLADDDPLWALLNPVSTVFPADAFAAFVRRLAEASRFVQLTGLPELPQAYHPPRRAAKVLAQAVRLSNYLTIQAQADLSGERDFFRDIQALAFQAALQHVLPDLDEKHPSETAILVHSAAFFALEYSTVDPAHYCYLLSMIYHYLENDEQQLRFLHAAFRFTPPDDHSFLTKAQEYWSELLDCQRYEEAERFLISLPGFSLPTQQDEITEMISAAFKFMVAHPRESPFPLK